MTRETEPVVYLRTVEGEDRIVEGLAAPYGAVAGRTKEFGPEAFAPGAFAEDIDKWTSRQDGAKLPFRPAHRERPIGSVVSLRDTPEGVMFRAKIRTGPRGDEYLADVADGLNGVSVEFDAPAMPRRTKDGVAVHRQAQLMGIAGSVSPAYDGARIALRDMEDATVAEDGTTEEPAPTGAHTHDSTPPEPSPAERDTAMRKDLEPFKASAVITRPELVYGPSAQHSFFRDQYLMSRGDAEAAGRVQKHQGFLHELAVTQEREAESRVFGQAPMERASDVLSSELPGAYPNDYIPGLLTPRILKGRPMGNFFTRFPIADARPRIFPKVTTSTAVAVQSAEGAALSGTDLATTAVTATPLMYGAFTDVSRQALDGADPSVLAIIFQDLVEAYAQASETVIKTAVEAGSTASGVAITAATPYAGTLANVINYYGTRFRRAEGAFIPSALYSVLLAQGDTTGRPFLPMIGQMNSDGSVDNGGIQADVLGASTKLSYASTANVCVFGVPSDFVIYESAIAQFTYDQVVGPQAVRVGLWAYLVVGTRLGSLKVTAA